MYVLQDAASRNNVRVDQRKRRVFFIMTSWAKTGAEMWFGRAMEELALAHCQHWAIALYASVQLARTA